MISFLQILSEVTDTAKRVAECQKECGLDITVEEYVGSLHIGLIEVVYEWAKGTPFKDVMNLTDVSEGMTCRSRVFDVLISPYFHH